MTLCPVKKITPVYYNQRSKRKQIKFGHYIILAKSKKIEINFMPIHELNEDTNTE
jgi:hypothetical protein